MLVYALKRLAYSVPMLFGVSSLAFLLLNMLPSDIAQLKAGEDATPETIAAIRESMGLNRPVYERYFEWLGALFRGDFGVSWHNEQPVIEGILASAPVTLSIVVLSLLLALVIGIPIGVIASVRGGRLDRILVSSTVVALAIPNFWLGLMLVLAFSLALPLLPATGYVPLETDPALWLRHLVLPVIAVASVSVSAIARQTRSAMVENLNKDYVRTLRAAGMSETSVIFKHTLKNSAVPVLTVLGIQFVNLSGGSIIVEQVFAVPGLGQYTMAALARNDVPVVLGVLVVTAIAVVIINLIVDLANSAVNPKVRA